MTTERAVLEVIGGPAVDLGTVEEVAAAHRELTGAFGGSSLGGAISMFFGPPSCLYGRMESEYAARLAWEARIFLESVIPGRSERAVALCRKIAAISPETDEAPPFPESRG